MFQMDKTGVQKIVKFAKWSQNGASIRMVVGSRPEVTEGGQRAEVTGGQTPTTILILLRFQVVGKRKKLQTANQSYLLPKIHFSTTYQKMGVLALMVAEI